VKKEETSVSYPDVEEIIPSKFDVNYNVFVQQVWGFRLEYWGIFGRLE
jgi:hypothetical protein